MAEIVIMGAGLGGTIMAYEMKDHMRPEDRLTVVTKDPVYHFVPSNPWVPVGWRTRESIEVDLAPTFAKRGIIEMVRDHGQHISRMLNVYDDSFGSLVAVVVTITQSQGVIQLVDVACAVDCGMVINPNTAAQQVEGGIIQGLSSALWGQMKFTKGVAQTSNFDLYRLMRMADMPSIEVSLLQTPGAAIGGLGEVGVPCISPALANAWYALTGKRLRTLPLFP